MGKKLIEKPFREIHVCEVCDMYRQYENPSDLEDALLTCKAVIKAVEIRDEPFSGMTEEELDELMRELKEDENSLEERINFAYQDEEYDEMWEE